ncbi:hypothetical protein [Absidia glauca]|uniref:Cytochrome P450 n=1 Tax=Absidia glauca TaxID=4829 RepID=A0A163V332_ABSGL|nr:hypothetical protein [Absidia glauca]
MLLENDGTNWPALVGTTLAIGLTLLAFKYNDRVVFDPVRPHTAHFKGWPLIGSTLDIATSIDRMHDFFLNAFETTGATSITVTGIGFPRGVVTVDPTAIEHILKSNFENYIKGNLFHYATFPLLGHGIFNANGAQWRYQRKTAALVFSVKNFRDHFTDVFVKELTLVCDIFTKAMETRTVIDFHDIMYKFTLDSFVLIGFGAQVNALTTTGKVPFAESFDILQMNVFDRSINLMEPIKRYASAIFTPWKPNIASHQKVVNDFAASVIQQRRASKVQTQKDLLSRFMETKNEKGDPLSDKELRDAIMNLTVAGRDTTAQTLSWVLYNLMLHPETEEKLVAEIQESVPDALEQDSPALYEAIKEMKYAYAVYAMGRNKLIWGSDAGDFKPERWITETGDVRRESQGKWPAFHAGHITYQVSISLPMKHGLKVMVDPRQ